MNSDSLVPTTCNPRLFAAVGIIPVNGVSHNRTFYTAVWRGSPYLSPSLPTANGPTTHLDYPYASGTSFGNIPAGIFSRAKKCHRVSFRSTTDKIAYLSKMPTQAKALVLLTYLLEEFQMQKQSDIKLKMKKFQPISCGVEVSQNSVAMETLNRMLFFRDRAGLSFLLMRKSNSANVLVQNATRAFYQICISTYFSVQVHKWTILLKADPNFAYPTGLL